jgi:hypothetical protein
MTNGVAAFTEAFCGERQGNCQKGLPDVASSATRPAREKEKT